METIKWVTTPACRDCQTPREFSRRFPCMGCEKQHCRKKPVKIKINRKLTKEDRLNRNKHIAELRDKGFSYERIAIMLKMPRATVQSAASAYLKQMDSYSISKKEREKLNPIFLSPTAKPDNKKL